MAPTTTHIFITGVTGGPVLHAFRTAQLNLSRLSIRLHWRFYPPASARSPQIGYFSNHRTCEERGKGKEAAFYRGQGSRSVFGRLRQAQGTGFVRERRHSYGKSRSHTFNFPLVELTVIRPTPRITSLRLKRSSVASSRGMIAHPMCQSTYTR